MTCMTLLLPPMAMATTQFVRVIRYEVSAPRQIYKPDRQPLRMNWVVATGKNGSRVLRMCWTAVEDC